MSSHGVSPMMSAQIDLAGIRAIRSALIVGLAAYAEIQRTRVACEFATSRGDVLRDGISPLDVGNENPLGEFVEAFTYLETAEYMLEDSGEADPK